MNPFAYLKGKSVRSRRSYAVYITILWLYSLLWLAALVATYLFWADLNKAVKVIVSLLLIVGTPSATDLFEPYDRYRERHFKANG
jgi:hypothetical protein